MSTEDSRPEPGVDGEADGIDEPPDRAGGDPDVTARVSDPSDAFQALGNEIRMGILEAVLDRVDGDEPARTTFSELFEASDVDTSAQFAYHLEQLVGPYLRKAEADRDEEPADADGRREAGYELTYAGLKISRAIAAGAYTRRVDSDPVSLEEPCPFCEAEALAARSADNVVTVACRACDRALLRLGFPPSGLAAHGDALPGAFDRHHRYRLALMRDGVCPECSGDVRRRLRSPATPVADALPDRRSDHVQAAFDCRQCGHDVRAPVTLALLEHPEVVSFYRDHGEAVRDRPIWNVGHEWAETVLSEEPTCVRVVAELDGELLALYVDERVRVREVQRGPADGTSTNERSNDGVSAERDTEETDGEPEAEATPD